LNKDKFVYDNRWKKAAGTPDTDILSFDSPKNQSSFFYLHYNKFIAKQLKIKLENCASKKLLELGCGRATASIFISKTLNMDVLPTDYSENAISIANENLKKYNVQSTAVVADLLNLNFPNNSFHAVISLGVMEHIEKSVDAYAQMHKVLAPGGVMISMNVPEKPTNIQRIAAPINKILLKFYSIFDSDDKPWLDKKTRSKTSDVYRTFKTSLEFAEDVKRAGFSVVEVYELNPFPTFNPIPKWIEFLLVKMYESILNLRRLFGMKEPFLSSEKNSRTHFIVAVK